MLGDYLEYSKKASFVMGIPITKFEGLADKWVIWFCFHLGSLK